ncbi:MAG: hypothetical protein ABIJ46_03340 [bacterium]
MTDGEKAAARTAADVLAVNACRHRSGLGRLLKDDSKLPTQAVIILTMILEDLARVDAIAYGSRSEYWPEEGSLDRGEVEQLRKAAGLD